MLLYCILDKWLCGKLPYHEALDFQDELEREWVADLRRRYTFTVNEDVLKTVNKHE